jgi:hypothetical protein
MIVLFLLGEQRGNYFPLWRANVVLAGREPILFVIAEAHKCSVSLSFVFCHLERNREALREVS